MLYRVGGIYAVMGLCVVRVGAVKYNGVWVCTEFYRVVGK